MRPLRAAFTLISRLATCPAGLPRTISGTATPGRSSRSGDPQPRNAAADPLRVIGGQRMGRGRGQDRAHARAECGSRRPVPRSKSMTRCCTRPTAGQRNSANGISVISAPGTTMMPTVRRSSICCATCGQAGDRARRGGTPAPCRCARAAAAISISIVHQCIPKCSTLPSMLGQWSGLPLADLPRTLDVVHPFRSLRHVMQTG